MEELNLENEVTFLQLAILNRKKITYIDVTVHIPICILTGCGNCNCKDTKKIYVNKKPSPKIEEITKNVIEIQRLLKEKILIETIRQRWIELGLNFSN